MKRDRAYWLDAAVAGAPPFLMATLGEQRMALGWLIGLVAVGYADLRRVEHNEQRTRARFDQHAREEHPR